MRGSSHPRRRFPPNPPPKKNFKKALAFFFKRGNVSALQKFKISKNDFRFVFHFRRFSPNPRTSSAAGATRPHLEPHPCLLPPLRFENGTFC
jgi:hypothetical protein